jgi:hypothetical protein
MHIRYGQLLVLGLIFFLITLSFPALATVYVFLDNPTSSMEQRVYRRLQTSPTINTAVEFLNHTFTTPQDIIFRFGNHEQIWYDGDTIEIPYAFIDHIRHSYNHLAIPHRLADVDDFIDNMLFHIIFHEIAHAFIEQFELPIVGQEEDAADGLADVLLIHFFDNGDDMVVSAADLFFINHSYHPRFSQSDYLSEHSLHIQRYYTRICHAYGSQPSKHLALKQRIHLSLFRAERCIIQYQKLERSWLQLLKPVFKNKP